jgi:hypothetical protein
MMHLDVDALGICRGHECLVRKCNPVILQVAQREIFIMPDVFTAEAIIDHAKHQRRPQQQI